MKKHIKKTAKGNITGVIILLVIILVSTGIILAFKTVNAELSRDTIRDNVYIDTIHVGGLTKTEALEAISEYYKDKYGSMEVNIVWNEYVRTIPFDTLEFKHNYEKAVDQAYSIGRSNNLIMKFVNLFISDKPVYISSEIKYSTEKIIGTVNDIERELQSEYSVNRYVITDYTLMIYKGAPFQKLNKTDLAEKIENSILKLSTDDIFPIVDVREPDELDFQRILEETNIPAQNAYFEVNNYSTVVIHNSIPGIGLPPERLFSFLEKHKDQNNVSIYIPLDKLEPDIKENYLKDNLFKHHLSDYTSVYKTTDQNTINRGINIGIAGNMINNVILGPGQEFSFNEIVGERTVARGYQIANVYYDGRVVDGIGGGICQVSSTLYNAVLFTTLEVTERLSHQFTVSYVPFGQDATVSYGYVDFKFRNNTDWPLKLIFKNEKIDNTQSMITFELIGTNFDDVDVEIRNNIIQERPFKTIVTYDNNQPEGHVRVLNYGSYGYVVETFKKVTINGQQVSNQRIYVSYYQPLDQREVHGSKKPPAAD